MKEIGVETGVETGVVNFRLEIGVEKLFVQKRKRRQVGTENPEEIGAEIPTNSDRNFFVEIRRQDKVATFRNGRYVCQAVRYFQGSAQDRITNFQRL